MKFKFSKNLDFQREAINAIVDIFDSGKNIVNASQSFKLEHTSPVIKNELEIDKSRILLNVQAIQEQNGIDKVNELDAMDFSIEMETGTGKTYVYLRTALELHQKYGLKKFIILVPSVAIREGVVKTIEQTQSHFKEIYGNNFGYFAYDSDKLTRVRQFVQSLDMEIMIMTIQAFNKDENIMRQRPDRFNGESPLELVAKTRPIVIMDEPQNMESELSKSSIADLKPLFKLRYSATHKEIHNLIYRLTPVDAYKKGLVKKIEIFGAEENDLSAFVFKVRHIKTERGESPKVKALIEIKNSDEKFEKKDVLLKAGDDLEKKSKNSKYAGIFVNEIDAGNGKVELSNGQFYQFEEQSDVNKEAIFRTQIHETIKEHFKKQQDLGKNIKVLSLFFIDRVDNYVKADGLIRKIFVEEFERLKSNSIHFKNIPVDGVHSGYFASKQEKGQTVFQDTSGKTKADKDAYDLIMKDKERLLFFAENTCFIFSHSALKEGWDNPNIFQICTLREVNTEQQRRQQIGRGMRLAVDVNGNRIIGNSGINVLTVIANESYSEFVSGLQEEYTEAGYKEVPQAGNAREKITIKFNKHLAAENELFKQLWVKINKRTKFNIDVKTNKLIENCVEQINELEIQNLAVRVDKVIIDFDKGGKIKTIYERMSVGERIKSELLIGNILERIVLETGVTKKTIFVILSKVGNLSFLFENPEEYVRSVVVKIKGCMNDLIINEGLQYLPTNDVWEISLFENFDYTKSQTVESEKSVYSRTPFQSEGERKFAENLQANRNVKLFTKLPPKFVIDTPLGKYNPDWAIVMEGEDGDKLYLVRETKFVEDLKNDLRRSETLKILCGKKHFEAIGVDFKVAQKSDLSDLK